MEKNIEYREEIEELEEVLKELNMFEIIKRDKEIIQEKLLKGEITLEQLMSDAEEIDSIKNDMLEHIKELKTQWNDYS